MAMTVTATMSGTPAQEHIYLQVKVLTGATEAGGASTSSLNASGGASASGSLTPNGTNSLPVWAATADNPGTGAFTALSNNTLFSSNVDGDDWLYGFGDYSGTVTGGTPVTFGGSCASSDYTTWAGYEILAAAGSTPLVDASSPALASATGAGIKTVTSASFSPPAGAVIVAAVCGGGNGTLAAFSLAVSDTGGGLTWTKRAGNASAADQNSWIFTATVPGGGAAPAGQVPARPPRGGGAMRLLRRYAPTRHPLISVPQAAPSSGAVALTGQGALLTAAATAAPATMAGQGSLSASTAKYIAGLAGSGAGYFADNTGQPRMVLGDAVWGLPGNAGRWSSGAWQSDFDTYLTTRSGQGFTLIYTKPIGTTQSGNIDDNGATFDSLYPFQGGSPSTGVAGANPSTGLTAAFWARIDYLLNSAQTRGISVFLNAIGYSSDFDSGPGPLAGKSTTEFQAYGAAIGARYAGQGNVFWHLADDYFSDNDSLITAFLTGLRGAGANQPVSIENMPESDSRNTFDASPTVLPWGTANAAYNFCYSYNTTYVGIEKAYLESSPIPVLQGDGYFYQGNNVYAGGSGAFAYDRAIRQDAWHAISSGARGIIHGSESTWQWQSTAQASSASDWYFANNAGVIRSVMEALPGWQTLVPDTSSVLVTSGRGTHASTFSSGGGGGQYEVAFSDVYVTASRGPDTGSGASLAVIYLSHATTIGIDQTKMVAGYTATAYDPVSGAATPLTPGASYNTGSLGNNSKGDPDWVIVLAANTAQAGVATIAGQGALATAATTTAPATIAGQGAVADAATQGAAGTIQGGGAVATAATETAPSTMAGQGAVADAGTTGAGGGLAGQGQVGAPDVTQSAPATIAGQGSLGPADTAESAPAAIGGQGALGDADALAAGGTLAGQGGLGPADATIAAPSTLAGQSALAASTTPQGTGSIGGQGSLGPPDAGAAAPATLAGQGQLATAAAAAAPAAMAGQGMLGIPDATLASSGALDGQGTLGPPGAATASAGTLAGQGALSGTGTSGGGGTTAGAATITGGGALTAGPVVLLAAAAMAGQGQLAASTLALITVGAVSAGTYPVGTLRAATTDTGAGTLRAGTWP